MISADIPIDIEWLLGLPHSLEPQKKFGLIDLLSHRKSSSSATS
jgi:hypothetical protein